MSNKSLQVNPEPEEPDFFRQLVRLFFQGLIYTAPIVIIFYVLYQIFSWMSESLNDIGLDIHPLIDPLIGIFFFLLFVVAVGALGSSIVFRPLFSWIDMRLEQTPVIKMLYTSVKDIMNAFIGSKKKFNKPVLVQLHMNDTVERIGFITQEDLSELRVGPEKVAVYLPFSYAISGILYIVPRERIKPLDAAPADVMKFIISGGVTDLSDEHEPNPKP